MTPTQKFEFVVRTNIIRSEKSTKGLDAVLATNPNQMNRLTGFLPDGTKAIIAQRPGKGGMDFNKLLGGKVFAVAADGMSPVYEKGEDKKKSQVQKQEDGLPLFSSSGFYLLSSKEYPALDLMEAYTLLRSKGEQVWMVTDAQLAARQTHEITSDMDWDLVETALKAVLSDEHNLVSRYDAETNKKRERGIRRAKEEAEDAGDNYEGVEYAALERSKKDGNPFVYFCWKAEGGKLKANAILRETETLENDRVVTKYFSVDESLEFFRTTPAYKELAAAIQAGAPIQFCFVQGHVMRTSVSFRRKAENILATPDKTQFGDAVYIHSALKTWTKGIIALMQSQHPNFPQKDYDAHHYVAACRQAEIGMNKKADGSGWQPPVGLQYRLADAVFVEAVAV